MLEWGGQSFFHPTRTNSSFTMEEAAAAWGVFSLYIFGSFTILLLDLIPFSSFENYHDDTPVPCDLFHLHVTASLSEWKITQLDVTLSL